MRLKTLRITNFRSFKSQQTFHFPQVPGLYFMAGENLVDPELGPNGAGKSTIWEALCWLLYGKTSRGLKAGDISNWGISKGTEVSLDYQVDQEEFTLVRTWSPNSWILRAIGHEDRELVQDDPENLAMHHFRLSFASFLHSVFLAQSSPMFLDLEATKKALVFAEIKDLDKWIGYSTKASKLATEVEKNIAQDEIEFSNLQGRIDSHQTLDFIQQIEEWEQDKKRQMKEILDSYAPLMDELKNAKNKIPTIEAKVAELKGIKAVIAKCLKEAQAAEDKLFKEQDSLLSELSKMEGNLTSIIEYQTYLSKNDLCNQCGQPITVSHKHNQSDQDRKKQDDLQNKLEGLRFDLSEIQEKINQAKEGVVHWQSQEDSNYQHIRREETSLYEVQRRIQTLDLDLDRLDSDTDRLEKKINPYLEKQQQGQKSLDVLHGSIQEIEERLSQKRERRQCLLYWVTGFRDIRLQLISDALQQLELEVNSCMVELGLKDWSLLFDIDRETKGGNVQRGFSVMVQSPNNNKAVPWESWSGGESQRLRIGTTMGLSDLIRDSAGCHLDLEVWDEPTQWLSPQGVSDLLEHLSLRAKDKNRIIWVVDHRSLGYGNFDGICTITKDKNGSSCSPPPYN